jgi:hypothetical protein
MSNKLMNSVALSAMLVGSSAFLSAAMPQVAMAQTQTVPGTQDKNVVTPVQPSATAPAPKTAAPSSSTDQGAAASQSAPANQTAASNASGEKFLTAQAPDDLSANQIIGHNVKNTSGESVGDINNLIVKPNGQVDAAVIGVGGFLGIGEKNVAVSFDQIQVSQDPQSGKMTLTTPLAKSDLKAAPEYKTLEAQNSNRQDTTTTGATPATPMAPANPAAPAAPATGSTGNSTNQ